MQPEVVQPYLLLVLYPLTIALVWRRSVFYRAFVAILLGVQCLIWWGLSVRMARWPEPLAWCFMGMQLMVALHMVRLVRARLRGVWDRALFGVPAHWFSASTMLSFPFAILGALGFANDAFLLVFVIALYGVVQSLGTDEERVRLVLDREDRGPLAPLREPPAADAETRGRRMGRRALRIVQITDPHLGPFMSPEQLRAVCERAVAMEPDFVFITGDLLTMESHNAPDAVAYSFAPLLALEGRTFACHGNHDHEDRRTVREGLERAGVRLLIDEWVRVDSPAGELDIVGSDFHFKERDARLRALFAGHDRDGGVPRIVLLHHPGHIQHIPEGEADLVLAGHTHGGHLGLLSLGIDWTVVRAFTAIPDHGLWARGRDRIYTHRGTGQYGFPLRLGVPREESLLEVTFDASGREA